MNKELMTNTIYMLGIGGIGMSALARYFRQEGKEVSGYDRMPTALTKQLESEGMNIHYKDDPAYIPCDAGLVIYTPAIPDSNRELSYCREVKFNIKKRAEVLGMIAEDFNTIAIAGTHGKTTISSMIAHIMQHSSLPVTAFIGGVMNNYRSNLIRTENSKYLLVEADEYDRSFLRLHPAIAVISAISADHLDIYGSLDNLKDTFSTFISQIDPGGVLIAHESLQAQLPIPKNTIIYGKSASANLRPENIRVEDHHFHFELKHNNETISICMQVPGLHNIENATAAAAVCLQAGMGLSAIRKGLETYKGVARRFEFIIREEDLVFVDDYAHHPEEITACVNTAKELYPGKKVTGIFQPHLFSRTRDFADAFAESLEPLDEIILLDIYPAREEPIKGVDAAMLLEKIRNVNKSIIIREDLAEAIRVKSPEVLLTMGAGDIDKLVPEIKHKLSMKA
jgi:UDP-N-acetylmuramate--alanine ligase